MPLKRPGMPLPQAQSADETRDRHIGPGCGQNFPDSVQLLTIEFLEEANLLVMPVQMSLGRFGFAGEE